MVLGRTFVVFVEVINAEVRLGIVNLVGCLLDAATPMVLFLGGFQNLQMSCVLQMAVLLLRLVE